MEQKKNPLMNRDEYVFNLDHSGKPTPSRHDILKEVAKEVKASEDVIIIDKIMSRSGVSISEVSTLVYKKKDDIPKGKLEKMKRRMVKKKKEDTAPAPAPAEVPKEEKPAESEEETKSEGEPKEEKPAESEGEEKVEETKPEEEPKEEKPDESEKEEAPAKDKKE